MFHIGTSSWAGDSAGAKFRGSSMGDKRGLGFESFFFNRSELSLGNRDVPRLKPLWNMPIARVRRWRAKADENFYWEL